LSFKLNGKRQQFAQLRYFHLHLHPSPLPSSPLASSHPWFLIALFNYFPLILVTFAAAICLVTFFVIISALLFNNFSLHTNNKKLDRNYIFQR